MDGQCNVSPIRENSWDLSVVASGGGGGVVISCCCLVYLEYMTKEGAKPQGPATDSLEKLVNGGY